MTVNAPAAAQAATELSGIQAAGVASKVGESAGTGAGGEEGKDTAVDESTPDDPLAYLRLLIKLQRQATEVSAAEARSRMGILEATGVDALGLVEDGEGDKAAAVEAGEGAQAASRKKGNALHKAMSAVGVIIATSLAVMKALASTVGPPTTFALAGIAGAMGAVQLATIMAAKTGGHITHDGVDVTGT
jgi:hypothetical protein